MKKESWMIIWMMAATTAGKQDKNNELCVQIWRRAKRAEDRPKKNYKLCYNNRIDNNNSVQCSVFFSSSFDKQSFNLENAQRKRCTVKRSKKNIWRRFRYQKPRLFDGCFFPLHSPEINAFSFREKEKKQYNRIDVSTCTNVSNDLVHFISLKTENKRFSMLKIK